MTDFTNQIANANYPGIASTNVMVIPDELKCNPQDPELFTKLTVDASL